MAHLDTQLTRALPLFYSANYYHQEEPCNDLRWNKTHKSWTLNNPKFDPPEGTKVGLLCHNGSVTPIPLNAVGLELWIRAIHNTQILIEVAYDYRA